MGDSQKRSRLVLLAGQSSGNKGSSESDESVEK